MIGARNFLTVVVFIATACVGRASAGSAAAAGSPGVGPFSGVRSALAARRQEHVTRRASEMVSAVSQNATPVCHSSCDSTAQQYVGLV